MFQYNFHGPLEINTECLERMAKTLYKFHTEIANNLGANMEPWEKVREQALHTSLDLIKAYHGIVE